MAAATDTITNFGRIAVFGDVSVILCTIVASSTTYATASGGLPIDLTAPLTQGAPFCQSTNASRGQIWYDLLKFYTSAVGYDGLKHWSGTQWWGSHDFQGLGFGLKTALDNAYDGHEDVSASVSCSSPNSSLTCGGESGSANFLVTDAINGTQGIKNGNALWFTLSPFSTTLSNLTLRGASVH